MASEKIINTNYTTNLNLDLSGLSERITNRSCYAKRNGNVIFLNIDVAVTGNTSVSMGNILLQGNRPSNNINAILNNGLGSGFISAVIQTSGNVILYPDGSGYAQGYVCFVV